jgi:hypothetical protein
MQTSPREQAVILNCQFQRDSADQKLYYVFSGTADHYIQFRELMSDYGVFPAHEIVGHRFNPATHKAEEEGVSAPVVDTAPVETKSSADTSESPELSVTEGVTVTPDLEGEVNVAPVSSTAHANGGQSAPGGDRQSGASAGGDVDDRSRSGAGSTPGGSPGGEAVSPNPSGSVHGSSVDEFAGLTENDSNDPFAGM